MTPENEDRKQSSEADSTTNAEVPEIIRDLVQPRTADTPVQSGDRGSPGVQERDVIAPVPPTQAEDVEVVRRLIVPDNEPSQEEEDNRSRSPGIQDKAEIQDDTADL
jgi:hypothetical protein